jgi:signal transduction histidine kinase
MGVWRGLGKNKEIVTFELVLIGSFSIIFGFWAVSQLGKFQHNGILLIYSLIFLGVWFVISELIKLTRFFDGKGIHDIMLFLDTILYTVPLCLIIFTFYSNSSSGLEHVDFIMFLPAVSIPMYYKFYPGLLSMVAVCSGLLFTNFLYFGSMPSEQLFVLLEVVVFLILYTLISLSNESKSQANIRLEKTNEKLLELDKEKDNFISTAAHELRGPVTVVEGYLSILKEDKLTQEMQKDAIRSAYSSTRNLVDLIKRLLDVSRIQLHRLRFDKEYSEIKSIGQKLIADYKTSFKQPGIRFNLICDENIKPILMDKELITEAISNLLNNALKFTTKGSIDLIIKNSGKEVTVCVADTGSGIPKKDTSKIFKKFFQSDNASSSHHGLGLGLHLVHEIILGHGGRVWVESELGSGTKVFFTIPKEH